ARKFFSRALNGLEKAARVPLSPGHVSALPFFPLARCMQEPPRPSGRARASSPPPHRGPPGTAFPLLLTAERAPHGGSDALPGPGVISPRIFLQRRKPLRHGLHGELRPELFILA